MCTNKYEQNAKKASAILQHFDSLLNEAVSNSSTYSHIAERHVSITHNQMIRRLKSGHIPFVSKFTLDMDDVMDIIRDALLDAKNSAIISGWLADDSDGEPLEVFHKENRVIGYGLAKNGGFNSPIPLQAIEIHLIKREHSRYTAFHIVTAYPVCDE